MNDYRLGGSIPQMNRGGETPGIKPLFYSRRESALLLDKTLKAGYGALQAGTVMSLCDATDLLVPYAEADANANNTNAKVYITQALTDADKNLFLPLEQSYILSVGDILILDGSGSGTKEVQSMAEATLAEDDVYSITYGDTTIATAAADSDPTTAELVTAIQAATGYNLLPFVATAGSSAVTFTWKVAGDVSTLITAEKTTGSGTTTVTQTTPGVDVDGDATAAENLGAITRIDRTGIVGGTQAQVYFTTGVTTAANFTAALFGCVYVKSDGEASTPFSKAKYILDQSVDTGTGEYAKGALGSVVISNAVVYTASLVGMDAAAITDMGTIADGRFTILK